MIELIEAPPREAQLLESMPLEDGTWATPQGATVTVCRVTTPEGRIPTVQIRYEPQWRTRQACPHTIWLPDVARCYGKAKGVLERYLRDVDSIGGPIRSLSSG